MICQYFTLVIIRLSQIPGVCSSLQRCRPRFVKSNRWGQQPFSAERARGGKIQVSLLVHKWGAPGWFCSLTTTTSPSHGAGRQAAAAAAAAVAAGLPAGAGCCCCCWAFRETLETRPSLPRSIIWTKEMFNVDLSQNFLEFAPFSNSTYIWSG